MKRRKKTIKKILICSLYTLLFCCAFLIISASNYLKLYFPDVSLEQLVFHLKVPLEGVNTNFIWDFLKYEKNLLPYLLIIVFISTLLQSKLGDKIFHKGFIIKFKIAILNNFKTFSFKVKNFVKLLSITSFILSIIYVFYSLDVYTYIANRVNPTTIYEDYYANPKSTKLTFPEKKRNLIYIFLESMESSYADMDSSVSNTKNLIPNLKKIAEDNISFSNTSDFGGAYTPTGTTWTMGAMFAQTTGIPLSLPADGNIFGKTSSKFIPGAYSLGDILDKEGYKQYLMIGSKKKFGGRSNYFEGHGNYDIFDYDSAKKENKIPDDYFVFWGFEDKKLFSYAKEKLNAISKQDEPFNFTLLTVNTHFPTGYIDDSCDIKAEPAHANSVICSDKEISDFINWIKEQDFYDNTTIVISGDHLMMGSYFFPADYSKDRKVYNAFINSAVKAKNTKNREFTTLDMFPSTLAAMGVKIEGNRLGLGTNLFSSKKTVAEKIGYEKLEKELSKTSEFYNKEILFKRK